MKLRIIDRTREAMGWNNPWQTRRQNQIKRIVIHHSATATGNMRVFENHWRSLGWRNGGYAEIILPNGDVERCYPATVVTNGAGVWNLTSYHICMVGNFRKNGAQPTAAQMQALLNRIRHHMSVLNISANKVKGHKELMPTICPGLNMSNLRNQVRQQSTSTSASANANTHTVRSGETLGGIANHYQTTVAELVRLNNIANPNRINVGQVLRLPNHVASSSNMHRVTSRTGGFINAADARDNRNRRTWVQPGNYHVFNRALGMINVTERQGQPGSWINPNS